MRGLYHSSVTRAIVEATEKPTSCVTENAGVSDDLRPRSAAAAARPAFERAAAFGDLQPCPDRLLRDFGPDFPPAAAGAVGARSHFRPYEAGTAPAPRGSRGDPPARAAAGVPLTPGHPACG